MKISCDCRDTITLDEITEFQGGLKDRSPEEVGKIIKSLKKYGFAFPLFVWKDGKKNWCLDGHGRLLALKKMRQDGEKIPPLPVVYVKAKDEGEARNLLLRLNSHRGGSLTDWDKYSEQVVLDAVKGSGAIMSVIADRLGVTWTTARKYVNHYPSAVEAFEHEENKSIDFAQRKTYGAFPALGAFSALRCYPQTLH